MKRLFSFLIIFLIIVSVSFSDSIINDIETFSKLFPRPEGSTNNIETMQLISEKLDGFNVKYTEVNFNETEGYHSFSSYIEVDILGVIEDSIISLVPVEGSYAIAAALSLIEHYNIEKPELSLKFIFIGTEESSLRHQGTRNFLEHYYQETPASFIYLNLTGTPKSIRVIPGADGECSPFLLFKSTTDALKTALIPYMYSNTESILFRLSAAGTESMIKPYLSEGYPAIELTVWESVEDDFEAAIKAEQLIIFFDNLQSSFRGGLPSDWDSHYIFGIGEQQYLLIYILILTSLMIYPIFRRRHFGWYMHTLIKNIWSPPLLFGFIFVFLSISSILLTFLLNNIGFEELWKYNPGIVFLFKITNSLLMYSLVFKLIKRLPFSKRGSFYSISAILFLVIELFILTMINLSLSFFALWPLLFIFLFTIFRRPLIKLLMLLLSTILIAFSLFEIFTLPALPVLQLITISPIQGDLLLALMLMPFILSTIRLEMLSPPSRRITRILPIIFAAISLGLFVLIIIYSPFSETNPQPVLLTEIINDSSDNKEISITSPKKIEGLVFEQMASDLAHPSNENDEITIEVNDRSFLNRKIVNISLGFEEIPEQVKISLYSDEALTLYESNFPAEWLPGQNRLRIFIGKNPAIPIKLSLTLNKEAEINLEAEAEYPQHIDNIIIDDEFYSVTHIKTVKRNYNDVD